MFECGGRFYDGVNVIGYFYEEKDGKVDKLKEVAKDLIGLVGGGHRQWPKLGCV